MKEVLLLSNSSLSRSGIFLACPVGPAAEPGIRSNDNSRVSRTESCVTDCHDSGRCEGVKGEEGASCAECVCEYECPGGVAGSGLSRGSDDWPAVDKDKGGGSGRDWVRGFAPRGLLLVSIVEDKATAISQSGYLFPSSGNPPRLKSTWRQKSTCGPAPGTVPWPNPSNISTRTFPKMIFTPRNAPRPPINTRAQAIPSNHVLLPFCLSGNIVSKFNSFLRVHVLLFAQAIFGCLATNLLPPEV